MGLNPSRSPAAACRHRRLPARERLSRIEDAAFEEFAEAGYAGARMDSVANRAGVTKALLYHYFPGKADLFRAVARSRTRPVFEEAEALVAGFRGGRAALIGEFLRHMHRCVAGDERERVLLRLMLSEGGRFPEIAEFHRAEVMARGHALVCRILREGVASGEFRPVNVEAAAHILVAPAILLSTMRTMYGEGPDLDADAFRDAHIDMLLRGLLAPGPVPGDTP